MTVARVQLLMWTGFGLLAAAAAGGLAWLTVSVLALSRSEAVARMQAQRTELVRSALWRLDSTAAPLLADGQLPRLRLRRVREPRGSTTALGEIERMLLQTAEANQLPRPADPQLLQTGREQLQSNKQLPGLMSSDAGHASQQPLDFELRMQNGNNHPHQHRQRRFQ